MHHVDQARLQQLRDGFVQRGESIVDWAKQNQFRPEMVYAVLAGRHKGLRGEGHRIAVALGLKANASGPRQGDTS